MRSARSRLLAVVLAGVAALVAVAAVWASGSGSPPPSTSGGAPAASSPPSFEPVRFRRSRAVGKPWRGRLERGVQLPADGPDWFTWDPHLERSPNRAWRRHGHDRLIRTLLSVLAAHRAAHPGAPRVGVGDLSRPRGGNFGRRYGGLGHRSHQNGLDVDLLYPRLDRVERKPWRVRTIDRALAQDLVDRFVAAGARYVFVGPATRLRGPRGIVQRLRHHDDHMHVRLRARAGGR